MTTFSTEGAVCIEREISGIRVVDTICRNISELYDIDKTCKWIKENCLNKICLQFPDCLLHVSAEIYKRIKQILQNIDVYILGDTSYASCCIDEVAASHVDADGIIHYGHTCLSSYNLPVLHVPLKLPLEISKTVKQLKEKFVLDDTALCLFYDVAYQHIAETLSKEFYKAFPNAIFGKIDYSTYNENKVLGRILVNASGEVVSEALTENYKCIFIGSDEQTLFNCVVSIPAESWYLFDVKNNKIMTCEQTMWFKRRRFLIEKCKDAKTIGILVCMLSGKAYDGIITRMKQLTKVNGKRSYIISVGKPNVAKLANFPEIDIYVLIACPENDLYSSRDFYKPIVYPYELELALNSARNTTSSTHITDFRNILPGSTDYCDISKPTNETDVSLITGLIRDVPINDDDVIGNNQAGQLSKKENWALEQHNIGVNLAGRHWVGLEQQLGQTEVKLAEEGRSGIAMGYTHENNK